jgi:hypothetical protein
VWRPVLTALCRKLSVLKNGREKKIKVGEELKNEVRVAGHWCD